VAVVVEVVVDVVVAVVKITSLANRADYCS
jgi:hypothetical protein